MARKLKNWLKSYVAHTQINETPDIFHFCTGISTIASVLKRKVWIDQKIFKWFPNFYIVFVAPPGIVSKTTSIGIGERMLTQVPGVTIGPESLTWQAFVQTLADSKEHVEIKEIGKASDDLVDQMWMPMCCVTFFVGEFGTLFDASNKDLIDVLTSLWDSKDGAWKKATKTQGSDVVENPWVNIIGCTTPSWIERYFPEYLIGGGLTSRTIFVYADKKRKLEAYPGLLIKKDEFDAQAEDLVSDLQDMATIYGEFEMHPEAIKWGKDWYEKHWTEVPDHLVSHRYGGYRARKQTHIHKIAMVLSISRSDELVILKEDLVKANRFITALESDMAKVFQSIGVQDSRKHLMEILSHLRARKTIRRGALWKLCVTSMDKKEYDEGLTSLSTAGLITMTFIDAEKDFLIKIVEEVDEEAEARLKGAIG